MILITGASSFIGRYIVADLTKHFPGEDILGTYHQRPPAPFFHPKLLKKIRFVKLDLEKRNAFKHLPNSCRFLVHTAAFVPANAEEDEQKKESIYRVNFLGAIQLAEWCRKNKYLKQLVISSTASMYASSQSKITEQTSLCPRSHYAVSKYAADQHLQNGSKTSRIPLTILRYSSVYGIGQSAHTVLPLFFQRIKRHEPVQLFSAGKRCQDFVYVKDVALATRLALQRSRTGIFNIASGEKTTMKHLAVQLKALCKSRSRLVQSSLADQGESREFEIRAAKQQLGFHPEYSLKAGIQDCFAVEKAGVIE